MNNGIKHLIDKIVTLELNESFRGFSLKKFKSLDSLADQLNYVNRHLQEYELGMGDNRLVYIIGSGKVLKIIHKNLGFFDNQNMKEVETWKKIKDENLVPRIYDYDKSQDCKWIIAEMAKPINKNYKKYFNLEPNHISVFLSSIFEGNSFKETIAELKEYVTSFNDNDLEFLKKAYILESKYNITDLKFENWGFDTNGDLLLLDAGV